MSTFHSFRAARWIRTLNLVLQAILFVTLGVGLNYLARNHPSRYDLTKYRRYSLSAETLSWIQQLKVNVKIVSTLTDENANSEIRGLLNEYRHATEALSGKIEVVYLDVYQNRGQAERLGIDQADVIVLICGDRTRILPVNELYRMEKSVRTAFQGEQVITAAILDVSSPTRKKVYFLSGHGEQRPDDTDPRRGLSIASDMLRQRNFEVGTLELGIERKIPDDASLLISVNPNQTRFTAREQELLRQYLSANAGRLILFLPPGQTSFGLDDLLDDWGVIVDNDLICDTGPQNLTDEGDLIIGAYLPHPITQTLLSYNIKLNFGPSRSVWPHIGRAAGTGLNAQTLAATSTTAWGEVSYQNMKSLPEYNRGVDLKARPGMDPSDRLGVVVASERVGARDLLPFSVPRGRLVVFGTGDLIANNRIVSNLNIFFGAVNWTVDRDTQLNIPARPIEQFQLSLSASDFAKLRYSLLLVLPGAAAVLGLLVYWTRRS